MSVNFKMTALADEIRELSGVADKMSLDDMKNHVDEANTDVATEANLIEQIVDALEGKAADGEQATPEISVSSNGLITATAGIKTSTYQLAFQPAKTITPTTASQIAVSSGYYTGGNVMVAGDANLVAGNIKSGVSIFGVNGNYAGSGGSGGNTSNEDGLVARTLTSYTNDRVTTIGTNAFYNCSRLTTVSFPAATSIGTNAFHNCDGLTTVSFPAAITIGSGAFIYCSRLTTVSFPAATSIGSSAFYNCRSLTTASFPAATSIGDNAFYSCTSLTTASFPAAITIGSSTFYRCVNLKSLYLTGSSLCRLSNSNAFTSTPIGGYSTSTHTYGSIYVPASLLTSYQTATNWTYFSSRFVAYDGVNMITFTIEGTQYQAEEGMTFGDWVFSKYNTDGFSIVDSSTIHDINNLLLTDGRKPVFKSALIHNGNSYSLNT